MAIVKIHKKENPYLQIDKQGIEDSRLSWGATGLLAYLVGRPDNWEINITHLSTVKTDKRDATRKYLNELREFGYCHYFEFRKSGKVVETTYLIFETPTDHEIAQNLIEVENEETILYKPMKSTTNSASLPKTDLPFPVQPLPVKQPLIIIDNNNKDLNNKKTCNMSISKKTKKTKLGTNKKGFPIQDKWEKFLIDNLDGIDYQNEIQKAIAKLEKNHPESYIQKYLIETYTNGLANNLNLKIIAGVIAKGDVISKNQPKPKNIINVPPSNIKNKNIEKTENYIKTQSEEKENLNSQKSNIILTPELEKKAIELLKENGVSVKNLPKTKLGYENTLKYALKTYQ